MSVTQHRWLTIRSLLADTGADISVLPRDLGAYLVGEIHRGAPHPIKGIVPGAHTTVYIHHVWCRWNGRRFQLPVAIADTNDVPLIFGRTKGLDRFIATFVKGRETRLDP